jgi:hypothetical protein
MTAKAIGTVEMICLGGGEAALAHWLPFIRGIHDSASQIGRKVCVLTGETHHDILRFYAPDVELRPLFGDMSRPDPSPTSLRAAFEGLIDFQPRGVLVLDGGAGYLIDHVSATFRKSQLLHVVLFDPDGEPLATIGSGRSLRAEGPANFTAVANAFGFFLHPAHVQHAPFPSDFQQSATLGIIERFAIIAQRYCVLAFDMTQFATPNGRAVVAGIAEKLTASKINCVVLADDFASAQLDLFKAGGDNLRTVFSSDLDPLDIAVLLRGSAGLITNRPTLACLAAHLDHPCLSLWGSLTWRRGLPEAARGVAVGIDLPMAPGGGMATCALSAETVLNALDQMTPTARTLQVIEDEAVDKAELLACLAAFAGASRKGFAGGYPIGSGAHGEARR